MKISEYAVKNYQFTLVMFLMTVALGITTMLNMPRSEDPAIDAPQFPVVVIYPGTSPADMEELVVKPLENRIYELEDIKRIKTSILDGVAVLTVEYKYESDVTEKYQELVREVNSLRSELPEEVLSVDVKRITPSGVNIMQIALISENASDASLRVQAERLKEQLEKVNSLKDVKIHGLPDPVVRVDVQLDRLAALRIPLGAVMGALKSEMANIPGGSLDAGGRSYNIKTSGNYRSIEEIASTVILSIQGRNIQLKDIAYVHFDQEENKHITRLNGNRCLFITAAQKEGQNISKTREAYKPLVAQFSQSLPKNIDLVQHFDQAEAVEKRLSGLGLDFLIAIALVAITLLPLGFRAALIVMISIPLSLAIGLVLLNVLGFTLNQLSIVGLVVALGLLVDDSIVVVENIERWMREGHSRKQAVLQGTRQIGLSVVGCTVTLIIAFMPLLFLPEGAGDFIRSLPMAVITSVLASMLVALTIIPFLSSRLLKEHHGAYTGNVFLRALQKGISGTYSRWLDKALDRPVLSLVVAGLIFGGSLALFPVIGFSLFPASEKPQLMVNVVAPLQTSLEATDATARKVEEILKKEASIAYFASNVGKGNPRIYYNVIPPNERSDFAQFFVQLQDGTSAAEKGRIAERLRASLAEIKEARIEVKNFEQGPPIAAPIEIRLSGENLDTLRKYAFAAEQTLNQIQGAIYIDNPLSLLKSDIKVDIDIPKARALGINTVDVDRTVRMAVAGLNMGAFTDSDGKEKDILLGLAKRGKPELGQLREVYINTASGASVPLSHIAKLSFDAGPLSINHLNKTRTVSVTAFVDQGFLADNLIQETIQKFGEVKLPTGYQFEMGGEFESRKESFDGFNTIILITVFLFIAVLVLLFKTFKSTIIVLSVIPLGMVGALTALWITGNSLSFVAIVGLIALAGIEVKNSILLVDFTNQLRAEGKTLEEAIREAGEVRFLPIVLTSLTAIGGLIPIAISTNPLIAPLAIVLIGGLISSTLLSRIVTPVVYKLIPPHIEKAEK